ncbi:MAG: hypothetical protein KDD11_09110 [Acidobacteria bacterium]|nr:hypothetical protein [Acidobacteriota bacterium]
MSTAAKMLERLGLDKRWFTYGIVDEEFLAAQCMALDEQRDGDAPEHYRTPAYARFFKPFEGRVIPMERFAQYLELVECEPEAGVRSWAVSFMTEREPLSPEQFAQLATHPLVVGTKHALFLERNRLRQQQTTPST